MSTALWKEGRSVIVAVSINTLAPNLQPIHSQMNIAGLYRHPETHITGESSFWQLVSSCKTWSPDPNTPPSLLFLFICEIVTPVCLSLTEQRVTSGRWQKQESLWAALPSLANGTDWMASVHWWTRLVMFSLFLGHPPHPFLSQCLEVAETYIALSVFSLVVFLSLPLFSVIIEPYRFKQIKNTHPKQTLTYN